MDRLGIGHDKARVGNADLRQPLPPGDTAQTRPGHPNPDTICMI